MGPLEDKDRELRRLVANALVPRGMRPVTSQEIDATLDALGGDPIPEDQVDRILRKARGDLPIGVQEHAPTLFVEKSADYEQELLALHRGDTGELPPDVQEKLEALRRKADEELESDRADDVAE